MISRTKNPFLGFWVLLYITDFESKKRTLYDIMNIETNFNTIEMTLRTYIEPILNDLYTEKVYGSELEVLPLRQSGKETMDLP